MDIGENLMELIRLIVGFDQREAIAYQLGMSPDSKTVIVLLEWEVFNDDV